MFHADGDASRHEPVVQERLFRCYVDLRIMIFMEKNVKCEALQV